MRQALIVGNGESRQNLNLHQFKKEYTVIGCNALHRDLTVDHLVCCDRRMADEAILNPNNFNTLIYVRESWYHYFRKIKKNKNIRTLPDVPTTGNLKKDQPDNWGSGCYAVLLGAELGFEKIVLLGFDLYGINNKVNNIYKNTQNYSNLDSQAVDHSFWVYQIGQIFSKYSNREFVIINSKGWNMPKEWLLPNVSFENISSYSI